ncbi:MAG: hypothetical protein LUQ04_00035 [Methanoregula sp.]|nr:hypothetical protein [Methanoregula sp.]
MGIPYLETGESIILTTGRVSINSVQYDVLLTTRNLILVDDRYGDFQPRIFPLFIIQSVKGGKTTSGELAITIFFADTRGTGEPEPMVLLFSQHPRENRKRERDDWLKKLMELIISVHQKTVDNEIPSIDHEIGIRPSMRRPVAPEIPPPYTTVVDKRRAPIDLTIIHDEPESLVFSEEREAMPENAFFEENEKPEVASELREEREIPGVPGDITGSPETIPALHPGDEDTDGTREQVPESPDIQMYDSEYAESTTEHEPESPDTVSFPDVPETTKTTPLPEEISESRDTATSQATAFIEINGSHEEEHGIQNSFADFLPDEKSSGDETNVSVTIAPSLPLPEKTPVDSYDATELPPEAPATSESSSAQEEKAEALPMLKDARIAQTGATGTEDTESLDLPAAPEPVIVESASVPAYDRERTEVIQQESEEIREADGGPAAEAAPHIPEPQPPSLFPGDRRPSFIAIIAIILIFLGIAGATFVFSQNSEAPGIQPAPVPTPGSNQTPLPGPSIQQLPVPAQYVIPSAGVWVRVLYPRTYSGWVGIPGNLKEVSGSGDRMYKIFDGDGITQVKIQKEDNSGDTLMVEVYREGTIIDSRILSNPMGSIEFMIDTRTGLPPGITPVPTQINNQTGSTGKIMYF